MPIVKAVRYQRKLRVGIGGPTGAGKTYTALKLASYVAGKAGARVGLIDTENFSASVYADHFDFDVNPLTTFAPDDYIKAMEEFERSGTAYVLIVDSLSHAWMGRGGALDQVDRKVMQGADSFTAWRTVSPQHNRLVDKLINYEGHLFLTLRSKMEHAIERDEKTGKNKVVKLGMAPVMRDGIEYECDAYFEIDQDHNLVVTKTRFPSLDGYVVNKAGEALAELLWQATQGAPAPERAATRPQEARTRPQGAGVGQEPDPRQYGAYATPEGGLNPTAFLAALTRAGLDTPDLVPVCGGSERNPAKPDVSGWLLRHPDQTLDDLIRIAAAIGEKSGQQPALVGGP
jgi:hypothetical protein